MEGLCAHGFLPFDKEHMVSLFGEEFASWAAEQADEWEQPDLVAKSDKHVGRSDTGC